MDVCSLSQRHCVRAVCHLGWMVSVAGITASSHALKFFGPHTFLLGFFFPLRCTIILDLYHCQAKIAISGQMKTYSLSQMGFLHDTDNILLPARLTFMTFRLAACRFTVSSLVLHFRGFLCAEAAPFVLVLRLSTALMS